MPDSRNNLVSAFEVADHSPPQTADSQARERLDEIMRRQPMKRPARHLVCDAEVRGEQHSRLLCWLPVGHDGWHVNPHLRSGTRPAGWLLVR